MSLISFEKSALLERASIDFNIGGIIVFLRLDKSQLHWVFYVAAFSRQDLRLGIQWLPENIPWTLILSPKPYFREKCCWYSQARIGCGRALLHNSPLVSLSSQIARFSAEEPLRVWLLYSNRDHLRCQKQLEVTTRKANATTKSRIGQAITNRWFNAVAFRFGLTRKRYQNGVFLRERKLSVDQRHTLILPSNAWPYFVWSTVYPIDKRRALWSQFWIGWRLICQRLIIPYCAAG